MGTAADAETPYDAVDLSGAVVVVGNEAHGMSSRARDALDVVVRIPQEGSG